MKYRLSSDLGHIIPHYHFFVIGPGRSYSEALVLLLALTLFLSLHVLLLTKELLQGFLVKSLVQLRGMVLIGLSTYFLSLGDETQVEVLLFLALSSEFGLVFKLILNSVMIFLLQEDLVLMG